MGAIPVCPAALPKLGRVALTPVGFDTPFSTWLGFSSMAPGIRQELLLLGRNVNTRSLSPLEAQARINRTFVDPAWSGQPVPAEWHDILPWMLDGGFTGAGTVASPYLYPLGSTLSSRYMMVDDTQNVWSILQVGVDSATISASQDDPAVKCSLNMIGVDYTTGATFPGGLTPPNTAPFIFTDSCGAGLTINGTAIKSSSFSLSISKNVNRDRFFNCPTIACAVAQDRTTRISLELPYGLHPTLWTVGGASSVPVVITFTWGLFKLTFSMPRVRHMPEAPSQIIPRETVLTWEGEALASAAGNDEISAALQVSA